MFCKGNDDLNVPDMPAPMMTTAALAWSLFPIGTSGQGLFPIMISWVRTSWSSVLLFVIESRVQCEKGKRHGRICIACLFGCQTPGQVTSLRTTCLHCSNDVFTNGSSTLISYGGVKEGGGEGLKKRGLPCVPSLKPRSSENGNL